MAPLRFLYFDHLLNKGGLIHGISTRQGGVSKPPFNSLNLGLGSGDRAEDVMNNRARLLAAQGLKRAVFLSQVHGDHIHVIERGKLNPDEIWDAAKGTTTEPVTADAVITDETGLGLVIQVADCQAVMLYDPQKRVIANVHSGWRGSVVNILGQCLERMNEVFGCRPKDVLAGISPSLGPCCSEFINYKTEIPETLWGYRDGDRPYFDFWRLSRNQLMEKGVMGEQIRQMDICTVCDPDSFFSYRGEKITGRFAGVIALKEGR